MLDELLFVLPLLRVCELALLGDNIGCSLLALDLLDNVDRDCTNRTLVLGCDDEEEEADRFEVACTLGGSRRGRSLGLVASKITELGRLKLEFRDAEVDASSGRNCDSSGNARIAFSLRSTVNGKSTSTRADGNAFLSANQNGSVSKPQPTLTTLHFPLYLRMKANMMARMETTRA